MSEQLGSVPSSPVGSLPLELSSAIITADRTRSRSPEPDRLSQLGFSISVCMLGGFEIVIAATHRSGDAGSSPTPVPAADRLELHANSILLSSLPDVLHLSGRSLGAHHGEAAARTYTLTLTFSDGNATALFWSTTFEIPHAPRAGTRWHLTVPFSHSLRPSALDPHATPLKEMSGETQWTPR